MTSVDPASRSAAIVEQADKWEIMRQNGRDPVGRKRSLRTGLTNAQARIYAFMLRRAKSGAGGLSQNAMAKAVGIPSRTLTLTLNALVACGALSRVSLRGVGCDYSFAHDPSLVLKSPRPLESALQSRETQRRRRLAAQAATANQQQTANAVRQPDLAQSAPVDLIDPTAPEETVLIGFAELFCKDEALDGPRRCWPVVEYLREHGERVSWNARLGRFVIFGIYGRPSPLDLVRRANAMRARFGQEPFPLSLADREEVAA